MLEVAKSQWLAKLGFLVARRHVFFRQLHLYYAIIGCISFKYASPKKRFQNETFLGWHCWKNSKEKVFWIGKPYNPFFLIYIPRRSGSSNSKLQILCLQPHKLFSKNCKRKDLLVGAVVLYAYMAYQRYIIINILGRYASCNNIFLKYIYF